MFYGIILIIAGLLAAPSLIAGKSKGAEDMLQKIAPFQGWIGVVLFIWGAYSLIMFLLNLGIWTALPLGWWVTILAVAIIEIILGILLGYSLASASLAKNPATAEKAKMLHAKLASKQTLFGTLGIIVGIWTIIGSFLLLP